jgi:hypothetical protein
MEQSVKVPEVLEQRRHLTESRLKELIAELERAGAAEIAGKSACVYATGSIGRGEMSAQSDLDIFIIRDKAIASPLTNLNEIRLKARLIEAARNLKFPDFSGDGEYVMSYDIQEDFIKKLGTRKDDYHNVLTARLLLVLESQSILGDDVYKQAIDKLLSVYWRDYDKNSKHFLPVFLTNDILRFWKTLCLNYEERTSESNIGKRRLLNYKLKYSRLLTCYSGVLYLLAVLVRDEGTVSTVAAVEMVRCAPTKRLEFVARLGGDVESGVQAILDNYAQFLKVCETNKSELEAKFTEPEFKKARFEEAKAFGNDVSALLEKVGTGTQLLRYLLV